MAAVNYTDNIIERLFNILESEFKKSVKLFKTDRPDLHINSISMVEAPSLNETTWSPNHVVDRIAIDIILRHKWQMDENKKEWFNRDYHKIKTAILGSRSDSTTGWFNGLVTNSDEILIETDEEDNPKFWKRALHFSCLIAYDHSE